MANWTTCSGASSQIRQSQYKSNTNRAFNTVLTPNSPQVPPDVLELAAWGLQFVLDLYFTDVKKPVLGVLSVLIQKYK